MAFDFNHKLAANGVRFTVTSNIIGSSSINDKVFTVQFNQSLRAGHTYTITLNSVSSTTGETLSHLIYKFTPAVIPYDQLPSDQKQAILKHQANQPYTKESINYEGLGALLDKGSSTQQIDSLKQAFYTYSRSSSKQFKSVTVDASSIEYKPLDREKPSLTDTLYFDTAIDGTRYKATLEETDLATVRLYLYDPATNALKYDSNAVNTSAGS